MSVFLTQDAVRARVKTATRRSPSSWGNIEPGEQIALIEKGQGLPKGAHQTVIEIVTIVSNRVEPLTAMNAAADVWENELRAEGFDPDDWPDPTGWMVWWAEAHGHRGLRKLAAAELYAALRRIDCRRIEWEYES